MKARALLEERLAFAAPSRRLRLALADRVLSDRLGSRPARLVDAGCGDGLLALALAKRHPEWKILGLDLRENLLEGARRRAAGRGLDNVEFVAADLTDRFPVTDLDVVLGIECLEEIEDDEGAMHRMSEALAPGGTLALHVPERNWRPVLPGSDPTWRDQVRQGYTARDLEEMITRAGLEIERIEPTYRFTAVLAQETRDRIKGSGLAVRTLAFPALAGAVRLERLGITGGAARAFLAVARRPPA